MSSPEARALELRFSLGSFRRVLWAGVAVFSLLGLLVELAGSTLGHQQRTFVVLFSLNYEENFPTLVQEVILLTISVMLVLIGRAKRKASAPFATHWSVLGWIFFYLALDEFVGFHEMLDPLVPTSGVLYYSWIVVYSGPLVVFALCYLKFLFHLPLRYRILFAVAGVIYVGGAMGMELPLGMWMEKYGDENLGYALLDWLEEALEMVGAAIFLSAVAAIFLQSVGHVEIETQAGPAER